MKKYKLRTEPGTHLLRVVALIDVPRWGVKAGDLGGLVEGEKNLSHEGDAWVGDEAEVSGGVRVYGETKVGGKARVYGRGRGLRRGQGLRRDQGRW